MLHKGEVDKVFYFKKARTTKELWEDAECMNCHDLLWEKGKIKYVWFLSRYPIDDLEIQVCERCFELI